MGSKARDWAGGRGSSWSGGGWDWEEVQVQGGPLIMAQLQTLPGPESIQALLAFR